MSSTSNHNRNFVYFETTPRAYYDHCTTATPNYDLYPSLSRRMGNGYVHRPSKPPMTHAQDRQVNFASMNIIHRGERRTWYSPHPLLDLFSRLPASEHEDDRTTVLGQNDDTHLPPWDLYPLLLRNVNSHPMIVLLPNTHHVCLGGKLWDR